MRLCIAGFNSVCENLYVPVIKSLDNKITVSGVFELSKENLTLANRLGFKIYNDYVDMLDKEAPDAVLILTPPSTHKEFIIKSCQRNIHCLVEKPLCIRLSDFDEIADASRSYDCVVYTIHSWRYLPYIAKMTEIAKEISPIKYMFWSATMKTSKTWSAQMAIKPTINNEVMIFDHGWEIFYFVSSLFKSDIVGLEPYFVIREGNVSGVGNFRIIYKNGFADIHLSCQSPVEKNICFCYGENGFFEFFDDRLVYETPKRSETFIFDEKPFSLPYHLLMVDVYNNFLESINDRKLFEKNLDEAANCIKIIELSYKKYKFTVSDIFSLL